jgi:hypothetical protein
VTMKNAVFWNVGPCRSGSLQPPAHANSSFADFSTLKVEAIRSSETSVHTRSTRHHIPEDGILQLSVGLRVLSSNSGAESEDGQTDRQTQFPRRTLRNERIEPITMLGISTGTHSHPKRNQYMK